MLIDNNSFCDGPPSMLLYEGPPLSNPFDGAPSLSLAPYPACKLDVFGHCGNASCVNGTQVRVFKETDQVGFSCFLQCSNHFSLKS